MCCWPRQGDVGASIGLRVTLIEPIRRVLRDRGLSFEEIRCAPTTRRTSIRRLAAAAAWCSCASTKARASPASRRSPSASPSWLGIPGRPLARPDLLPRSRGVRTSDIRALLRTKDVAAALRGPMNLPLNSTISGKGAAWRRRLRAPGLHSGEPDTPRKCASRTFGPRKGGRVTPAGYWLRAAERELSRPHE